ncbi:hypothetical protein IFM89_023494 [Coptis chinensis]|uniref:Uncharacterized protein n=1 Tax=Coptis chinensis TaxID=261450 RepID=A0A835I3I1_9MAGN|nr:hypothetical protein IFM89_023494 [Coptis chinensis]
MAKVMGRVPVSHRALMSSFEGVEFTGDAASLMDMMFEFYEDGEVSMESCSTNSIEDYDYDQVDDEKSPDSSSVEERKVFWEAQQEVLHETLSRTSSLESRIRKATKETLKTTQSAGTICICQRPMAQGCRKCLMSDISDGLCKAGYNSAICKSKWKSSPDIPSGEHTYIDVVDKNTKKREMRLVIELNFRAEFEMARASVEYNQLVNNLPEVFVGKAERLRTLIKIMCSAAKTCMREKKMHMGPWRKQKYMQAKWFGTCKRTMPTTTFSEGLTSRLQRPKASLLTFDLLEKLPSLHCTAVEVL